MMPDFMLYYSVRNKTSVELSKTYRWADRIDDRDTKPCSKNQLAFVFVLYEGATDCY